MAKTDSFLRKQMLRLLYRESNGSIERAVNVATIAKTLNIELEKAAVVAGQIGESGKRWARFSGHSGGGILRITVQGIEEAEKMERPLLIQWASEHPFLLSSLFGAAMSVLTGIIMIVASRWVNAWLQAYGW